jgi:outer membrane biosynthesis protein TonB
MYFDFEDNHPDLPALVRPLSWREGFLLSIIFHLVFILLIVLMPELPSPALRDAKIEREAELQRERERNAQRFVFVAPRRDIEAPTPPPRADASDKNRSAQAPERAPNPTNTLPFSRGNTPERVEVPGTAAPPPSPAPQPQPQGRDDGDKSTAEAQAGQSGTASHPGGNVLNLPGPAQAASKGSPGAAGRGTGLAGPIADALRNIQRYTHGETFDNPQGGAGGFGPSIQFDTKGVEFGPWIRRFIAQIKRNWFLPYAAMAMKGHVVVTFYVHKDGHITELAVPGPCDVEAFNNSAYNALAASNPTQQLPPEYPADRAFFTVTFYYNEVPPGQ